MITGAAGYIGSHLAYFCRNRYEVFTSDIKERPYLSAVVDLSKPFTDTMHYDTIVHLAAHCNVSRSTKNPAEYYRNNILSTINALTMYDYDNFIFASTGSAKGMRSPYSISKKACEDIVTDWCLKNNKNYTIFRFYNVTGSDGFAPTNMDGLFASLLRAEKEGVFTIYGDDYNTKDKTAVRDYTHVLEVCHSVAKAIDKPANGLEHLGHGKGTTVREMVNIYKKANDVEFDVVYASRRPGDLDISVAYEPSLYMTRIFNAESLLKRDKKLLEEIQ